ncbi:60S ribosomal protein L33B [Mucor velutinosus]|uniref:60S ribosomal protein L33B n=1 Tax=Mucor velutinosus TaxID=708070 RepID=A0AAN7D502_9FUNG|nr:60S ribosomal protein L33B [Mucor velutinosus]
MANNKRNQSPPPSTDKQDKKQVVQQPDVNISHSSWLYKLASAPSLSATRLESSEETEPPSEKQSKQEEQVNNSTTENTPSQPKQDNSVPLHANGSTGGSIWSWLGYSGTQSVTSVPESHPVSESASTPVPLEEVNETKQEQTTNDQKGNNSVTPQEHHHGHHHQSKPSYWKSFFTSNNNQEESQQDSVIISDKDDASEQEIPAPTPEAEQQTAPEEPQQRKPAVAPSRHNVVLPTFESQFNKATVSYHDSNTSLFSKAINAINSIIFTQKPVIDDNWQDINRLSTILDSLKADISSKSIVIIGVHGWFPMKLVRSMVGEPTGTSIKFCEQMTAAVKKYFEGTHNITIPDESIVNIPLQWEGKVLERVEKLYSLIELDYMKMIQDADIILWATHSQGTPVSAILLRKLIEEGIIQVNKQPICMLAMAGISHGPFPSLKGNLLVKYFEADAARELFDFMDSNSDISVQYREAMAYILQNEVKTVLVGSMQDQVVPLYSAIMSGISHPNILRAVYIDGHIYTKDDFLIRLITFALRLLNVGLSDHGFLIHISEVLAGNLYAWEGGHSTVYEELDVFMLPLQYLFETRPIGQFEILKPASMLSQKVSDARDRAKEKVLDKVKARLDPFQAKLRLNPFHLPWAMRGIWDDPRILEDNTLSSELDTLQNLFDKWNPTSARLKEIKFRLEPLKARL